GPHAGLERGGQPVGSGRNGRCPRQPLGGGDPRRDPGGDRLLAVPVAQARAGGAATSKTPAAPRAGRRHGGGIAALYLSPGMLGFAIFIVIPLLTSLVISFFDWPLFGTPEFVGLENYRYMLTGDPAFWVSLRNTIIFAVFYTAVNLVVALGLSYWLMNLGGRWASFFRVLFFIPVVTPMIGNALIFRLMLNDDGVI